MQTKVIKINPIFPDKVLIEQAAMLLRKGGLIAFPTETVYGIGANYLDKNAIDRLYKIKKRPKTKPFTIHIADYSVNFAQKQIESSVNPCITSLSISILII